MKTKTILLAAATLGTMSLATQSCMTVATSSLGIGIIKQILISGIDRGVKTYGNKATLLENNFIDQSLPKELKDINGMLEKVAPTLVKKEREYIAEAAVFTVKTSEPILKNAVNSLTAEDIKRIADGTPGTATQILKEKSEKQLIAAIMPKVDEKLNQYGIVKSINIALQGNNLLGSLLGGNTSKTNISGGGLSRLATEQIVDGLFGVIESHEKENTSKIYKILGK